MPRRRARKMSLAWRDSQRCDARPIVARRTIRGGHIWGLFGEFGRGGSPERHRTHAAGACRQLHAELIRKLDEDWQRFRTGRFEITEYRCSGKFPVARVFERFRQSNARGEQGNSRSRRKRRQDRATLEKRLGYVTGKEPFRANGDAEPYVRSAYGIRMVIRHDLRSENGYRVYTAFPVNEYVTKR